MIARSRHGLGGLVQRLPVSQVVRISGLQARPLGDGTSIGAELLPSYVEWLTCLELERDVRGMTRETQFGPGPYKLPKVNAAINEGRTASASGAGALEARANDSAQRASKPASGSASRTSRAARLMATALWPGARGRRGEIIEVD